MCACDVRFVCDLWRVWERVSVGKEEPLTLIFLMTFADFDSLQLFEHFPQAS